MLTQGGCFTLSTKGITLLSVGAGAESQRLVLTYSKLHRLHGTSQYYIIADEFNP